MNAMLSGLTAIGNGCLPVFMGNIIAILRPAWDRFPDILAPSESRQRLDFFAKVAWYQSKEKERGSLLGLINWGVVKCTPRITRGGVDRVKSVGLHARLHVFGRGYTASFETCKS